MAEHTWLHAVVAIYRRRKRRLVLRKQCRLDIRIERRWWTLLLLHKRVVVLLRLLRRIFVYDRRVVLLRDGRDWRGHGLHVQLLLLLLSWKASGMVGKERLGGRRNSQILKGLV